jgi:hypothetical protein
MVKDDSQPRFLKASHYTLGHCNSQSVHRNSDWCAKFEKPRTRHSLKCCATVQDGVRDLRVPNICLRADEEIPTKLSNPDVTWIIRLEIDRRFTPIYNNRLQARYRRLTASLMHRNASRSSLPMQRTFTHSPAPRPKETYPIRCCNLLGPGIFSFAVLQGDRF